jgi:lipopolysaccharide heptosyltransferase II
MKPERILIFELNWLGDILFSFPFIRALREAFPDAHIACVVVARYAELFANNPWINNILTLPDSNGFLSIPDKMMFTAKIKKERYDTCFLLKPSRTKTFISALAGIPERIGFVGKNAALTKEVRFLRDRQHQADQILALAEAVDVEWTDGSYEYFFSNENDRCARALLAEIGAGARRLIAINPGGNWDAKKWTADNFVNLAKKMLERFDDIEIMITGAEKDVKLAGEMVSQIASGECYSVAGKTGLNELAALFEKCELVISADSGPLHLASATGVTTIGLFGPTSQNVTGPRGKGKNIVISRDVGCRVPCYMVNECEKEYECMRSITVSEVFDAAEKVLSAGYENKQI